MYRQSSIGILLFLAVHLAAQNPHGDALKIDCAACHSPVSWEIPNSWWLQDTLIKPGDEGVKETAAQRFSHAQTAFSLTGQHAFVDCRSCHKTLIFNDAESDCITCHTDPHQMSVGADCARCHDTENWLVDEITDLHVESGFPLLGVHAAISCDECHVSETRLRFDRLGNECIDCHLNDYEATTSPGHVESGFSTDCIACHDLAAADWFWSAGSVNHLFFPLTKGHAIDDCTACHISTNFSNTPSNCFACHQDDFEATIDPDHQAFGFPMECEVCHATESGWPATDFTLHDDAYFPIFSGQHRGEWSECTDCHTVAGNFSVFSCIDCHEHNDVNDLADEHDEVSGYSYNSLACYQCHPKGEE